MSEIQRCYVTAALSNQLKANLNGDLFFKILPLAHTGPMAAQMNASTFKTHQSKVITILL